MYCYSWHWKIPTLRLEHGIALETPILYHWSPPRVGSSTDLSRSGWITLKTRLPVPKSQFLENRRKSTRKIAIFSWGDHDISIKSEWDENKDCSHRRHWFGSATSRDRVICLVEERKYEKTEMCQRTNRGFAITISQFEEEHQRLSIGWDCWQVTRGRRDTVYTDFSMETYLIFVESQGAL